MAKASYRVRDLHFRYGNYCTCVDKPKELLESNEPNLTTSINLFIGCARFWASNPQGSYYCLTILETGYVSTRIPRNAPDISEGDLYHRLRPSKQYRQNLSLFESTALLITVIVGGRFLKSTLMRQSLLSLNALRMYIPESATLVHGEQGSRKLETVSIAEVKKNDCLPSILVR
jgi:hypothetical protein